MPKDTQGNEITIGSRVSLHGTVTRATDQPVFTNVELVLDMEGAAPENTGTNSLLYTVSARTCSLIPTTSTPPPTTSFSLAQYAGNHVAESKYFRRELDRMLQELKAASGTGQRAEDTPTRASRHRSLAITHVEDAIMRLGLDLKEIHEQNPTPQTADPYPSSRSPESPTIHPTGDGVKL